MDRPHIEECYQIIHYYGSASFTDVALFLYGYEERDCSTANVITEELWL